MRPTRLCDGTVQKTAPALQIEGDSPPTPAPHPGDQPPHLRSPSDPAYLARLVEMPLTCEAAQLWVKTLAHVTAEQRFRALYHHSHCPHCLAIALDLGG